ncbi:MAG: N-acetyltransferase [Calditrichaeota bacterium]|nr:MAG: N-acetyltransferase [Calditrichota bacterium]
MNFLIETERLRLRKFLPKDSLGFFHLNNDPKVLEFTGDSPFASENKALKFIQNYDHYQKFRFGRWSVILKENQKSIGFCGLKFTEELNEIDLGFRFFQEHWNKGFATESSKAVLDFAFLELKLERIVARAMPENKASIRVIEKLGMNFVEERISENAKWLIFEKLNENL